MMKLNMLVSNTESNSPITVLFVNFVFKGRSAGYEIGQKTLTLTHIQNFMEQNVFKFCMIL